MLIPKTESSLFGFAMNKRVKLSERMVKSAQPREKDYHIFDEEVRGLSLCVYKSGNRAFAFSYRFKGRQRRYTIGRWPEWSVTAARERAKVIRRQIEDGIDPMEKRQAALAEPRISDLVDRYQSEHLPRLAARNASDQKSMLRRFVMPSWHARLVSEITPMDVDAILVEVAKGRPNKEGVVVPTPIRANRVGEVLRKMFNLAVKWGMRPDNPAETFRRLPEVERDRFLSPDEIDMIISVLDRCEDQRGPDIIRMCLLTGARLGEVRCATFEQFDLERGIWTKQASTTKQRKIHRVPISDDVVALIRKRRAALGVGEGWLFPGDAEGKPVQDLRRFWGRVRRETGLEDVRIHDLRHTFASLLVSGGASLEMIGKLLGHSQAKTTQRYAHLMDSPLREGVNRVAGIVSPHVRAVED